MALIKPHLGCGIPSVIVAGPGFVDQAKYTALNNGVPVMRVAEYPGAFATHTEEELIRNTHDVVWPQIVDALTRPISEEELSAGRNKVQTRPAAGIPPSASNCPPIGTP